MSLLRSGIPVVPVIAAVVLTGGAFPAFSPQDIISHARLQYAMRSCQQQDRVSKAKLVADERQARDAMLVCLRANNINIQ
jgi:hypothetical protein